MFGSFLRRGEGRRGSHVAGGRGGRGSEPTPQWQLDLAALGLFLAGIYLAFILYFGWNGGRLGQGLADGFLYLVGLLAYLVPLLLFGAATVAAFRPSLPRVRSIRVGLILLTVGLLVMFAAGTAGIAGGRPDRIAWFDPGWFNRHGGVIGESFFWLLATLLRPFGANLVAVFGVLGGTLLLTGTTISALASRSGQAVRHAGERSAEAGRRIVGRQPEASERPDQPAEDATRLLAEDDRDGVEPAGDGHVPSPIEVDIWADPGDEPGVSDRTEPLEPIRIFGPGSDLEPAAEGDDETAGPDLSGGEPEWQPEEPELPEVELESDPEVDDARDRPDDSAGEGDRPPLEAPRQLDLTPMGKRRGATVAEAGVRWRKPPRKLLERSRKDSGPAPSEQRELARKLVETLGHFGVEAKVVGVVTGPHVSRFELQLAPGTKVKKVSRLSSDLAYALASTDIRILAPIPGKQAVGVEVPNNSRKIVRLGDIYSAPPEKASPLVAWLGKGIDGKPVSADLASMPHVLVAGTTGSGKSACVNAVLSSILMHSSPNEVRMVLVDPKQVELNHYDSIPHLLTPVVTSPKLAATVLNNLLVEMETRYDLMKEARARNIADYNEIMAAEDGEQLPHILCVIDELADLMMIAPAEVESAIIRLAQKSRATGIHLLLATQRPSTDIITGTIKVNIPSRIAFAVSSQTDSRVILDQGGAESLLGKGDMLYRGPGTSKLARIQGAFVEEEELARITGFWTDQAEPEFEEELLNETEPAAEEGGDDGFDPDQDELLEEAIQLVVESETASVSMLQRRLRVGYTRAGRLVDMLERRGVISGYEGSKPRQVLITAADLPRILGHLKDAGSGPDEDETLQLQTVPDAAPAADPGSLDPE